MKTGKVRPRCRCVAEGCAFNFQLSHYLAGLTAIRQDDFEQAREALGAPTEHPVTQINRCSCSPRSGARQAMKTVPVGC